MILLTVVIGFSSCSKDYLDVSNELAGGLQSVEEVFDNPTYS